MVTFEQYIRCTDCFNQSAFLCAVQIRTLTPATVTFCTSESATKVRPHFLSTADCAMGGEGRFMSVRLLVPLMFHPYDLLVLTCAGVTATSCDCGSLIA